MAITERELGDATLEATDRRRSPRRAAAIVVGVLVLMAFLFPAAVVDWIDAHCPGGTLCERLVEAGWSVVDAAEALGPARWAADLRGEVRERLGLDGF